MAVAGAVQDFRRHLWESGDNIRRLRRQLPARLLGKRPGHQFGHRRHRMALWDLLAKSLGRPLASVLGGAVRERIPVYSNAWYFGAASATEFRDCARRTVALGYRASSSTFGVANFTIDEQGLSQAVERVEGGTRRHGPDVSLMVEGHGRFGVESALRVVAHLAR